ncbi:hypothetical protein CLCR_07769 [Cladophialophora carrionii]|uniref:Uncharacterized protein n=1 Tax=Cladophialophora carrionii TaxID=86049 RepID=A0A1C1CP03_9EURO|nr:hypothetical protein CLCR_07769 [Cladophialophora carrionii]
MQATPPLTPSPTKALTTILKDTAPFSLAAVCAESTAAASPRGSVSLAKRPCSAWSGAKYAGTRVDNQEPHAVSQPVCEGNLRRAKRAR